MLTRQTFNIKYLGTTDYVIQADNNPSSINSAVSSLNYPLCPISSIGSINPIQYSNSDSETPVWLQNPYSHSYYSSQNNGNENHFQFDSSNLYPQNISSTTNKLNSTYQLSNGAYYSGASASSNWATDELINPYVNGSSNNTWFMSSSKLALHPTNFEALIPPQIDLYSSKNLLNDAVVFQNTSTSNPIDSANPATSNLSLNIGTDYTLPNCTESRAVTAYDPVAAVVSVQSAAYAAHTTGFNFFSEVANSLFGQ